MKTLATIIAMLVCTASASPQLPDASALMEKSRAQMLCGSLSSKVTLTITEKNGTISKRIISMNSKSFSDDSEKRFIKFLEPADVRGTSMLISDYKNEPDEMWIWLPALKKTRRIVSTEKGKSFMSSEFTNSDMSSPSASEFTNNHAHGSGNGEYWIIESIPGDQEKKNEMGYSKK
ncbi:MAG: outer membrane lipoprotein-sorting protein [Bacteroidales bacterium]